MLENEFLQLGFNANEREVYLAIMRAGKVSPNRIAKETNINRTTVYSIGKKLVGLGLISEDIGGKFAYFYAEKAEALERVFAKEEEILAKKRFLATKVSAEVSALPSQVAYSVPKIKFVEEDDLGEYLEQHIDVWVKSIEASDGVWWGYQDDSFTHSYQDKIASLWERKLSSIKVCGFSNATAIEKELSHKFSKRNMRPLGEGVEFDSSLWVGGDYVVMVQTRLRPHYLVEIHDAVFARNQRQLFKAMWAISISDYPQ